MISAISSFSALSSNSQIIASTSDVTPVQQIERIKRKSVNTNDDQFNNNSKSYSQDEIILQGKKEVNSNDAYGLNSNELRNKSMMNQLSDTSKVNNDSEVNEEEETTKQQNIEVEKNESKNNSEINSDLSEEEINEVAKLKARDKEVKTHEQAHLAAAGSLAMGGASYEYQQGPDGTKYAVGGEVSIDTSPASTPEETIQKMQQVKAAALAPAEPSTQDRKVASAAVQQMMKARQEINSESENSEEVEEDEITDLAGNSETSISEKNIEDANSNIAEEVVAEAITGESTEKVVDSGLIEIPKEADNTTATSSTNNISTAKLAIQQQAARIAYGISA